MSDYGHSGKAMTRTDEESIKESVVRELGYTCSQIVECPKRAFRKLEQLEKRRNELRHSQLLISSNS
jgi:hypothetical protein